MSSRRAHAAAFRDEALALRDLCTRLATMRNRALFHALSRRVGDLREELGPWYRSLGYQEVGTAPYDHRGTKQPCHFVKMSKPLV